MAVELLRAHAKVKVWSLFDTLIFLYFFTLHADQLQITIADFTIRLNNLLALLLFAIFFLRHRAKLWRIDRTLLLSLLFLTSAIGISLLLSPYKQRCAIFFGWYGVHLLLYFFLPYFFVKYGDYKKVFSLYLASFLLVGIYAFLQLLFSLGGLQDPFAHQSIFEHIVRPNGFAYEPSFYALYMTPFIVMTNTHFLATPEEPFFFFKKLTLPKILCLNALYFVSTTTSTLFIFIVFCLSLFFFSQVRRRLFFYILLFALLFFVLGVVSPFLVQGFFLKFFYIDFMSHASFYERWVGIENGWTLFKENPYFGVGLGGYPPALLDAFFEGNRAYTFIFEHCDLCNASNPLKLTEAMNVFTEILASVGIVGAIAFLVLPTIFFIKAKQAIKYEPTLCFGLLLSVVMMLIALQINQGILRTYVWVHLALAFGVVEKILEARGREFRAKCTT